MTTPIPPMKPDEPIPDAPAKAPGMGRKVGVGMIWLMMNTAAGRIASFVAQIFLGIWLTQSEYGVVAMAVAFSAFVQVFRDGGARRLLIQRGHKDYESLVGVIFWMSLAFNLATGIVLASLAPVAGRMYGDPRVVPLLLVIATYLPLNTPAMVLQAKLNIDLRFQTVAVITATINVLRWSLVVLIVWATRDPIGFVIPMPICAVIEGVWCYIAVRDKPWKRRPRFSEWGGVLKVCLWIVVGTLATSAYNQGAYVGLGVILSSQLVGVYYFGYQISKQVSVLLHLNLQTVLLPSFARLQHDVERQRAAVLRTMRLLALMSAPAAYALLVCIEPLELLIWGGKWADSVPVVQILCIVLPITIFSAIPRSVLMAIGQFKKWSLLLLVDAAGVIFVACVTALTFRSSKTVNIPMAIAIADGAYIAIATIVIGAVSLRSVRVSAITIMKSMAPYMVIAGAIAGGVVLMDKRLLNAMSPLARVFINGGVFCTVTMVAMRLFMAKDISDALHVAPGRLRKPMARLLMLPTPAADEPTPPVEQPPVIDVSDKSVEEL